MMNVMKRAWEIYRTLAGDHFAKLRMALQSAWKEVKATVEENTVDAAWEAAQAIENTVEKISKLLEIICEQSPYAETNTVYSKVWENYGKKRMYFKCYDNSNKRNPKAFDYGYVDMISGEYVAGKNDATRRFTLSGRNTF